MANIQFQFRRGTSSEWTSANPTLAAGEIGIETDTNLFKIGNGLQVWNSLAYGGLQGTQGNTGFTGSTGGSGPLTVQIISSNTTASTSVDVYQANAQLTLTLPDPAVNVGAKLQIKNINNQEVTVVSTNGNIDGYSNMILRYKNSAIFVVATPTNWIIL